MPFFNQSNIMENKDDLIIHFRSVCITRHSGPVFQVAARWVGRPELSDLMGYP
jgi:hypothetical protein